MRKLLAVLFLFVTALFKIEAQSAPLIGSITHPTCATPTGSVELTGLPEGDWTLTRYPGSVETIGSGTPYTVTGLAPGTYYWTVTTTAGTSPNSSDAVINPVPTAPDPPTVNVTGQPTCETATGTIEVTAPLGAYQYNIDGGTFQSNVTFTGVGSGVHDIRARSSADPSCISDPTSVTIADQPETPTAPTVGTVTQPTCNTATGSVVLNGLPDGTWTINPGGISGSTNSHTISGLTPGTYNYTVTNDQGCTSSSSPGITINSQPTAPAAATITITQPTCAVATGIVTVTSPTGAYEYNIDGGTFQTSTTFSGVAAGSHTILVRRSADYTCISQPTSVDINSQPSAPSPATVSITQPTCSVATGNVSITAPVGAYEYNIDGGTYQTSTTFSGVTSGSHTILVRRSSDHTCISDPTSVTIADQPETPTAPIVGTVTQPTCNTATGSVVLNGLPDGTWTINPGSISGSTNTYTISGLTAGTYNYTVTNDQGCTSLSSSGITINGQPTAPAAATVTITQPTCAVATGIVTVTSPTGAYEYNIDGGTYQTSTTFSGVATGSHTILVRRSADHTCISQPTSVTINAQPPTPTVPTTGTVTQPTCSVATGSVVLNGLPSSGSWTVTRSPGGTTYTGSGLSTTITGLPAGTTYTFTVTNSAGCTSSSSNGVVINAQPITPSPPLIGTVTQPTCSVATGSVILNSLPASGSWTVTRTPGGTTYTGTGTTLTISGLSANTTYTFVVTNAAGCTSSASNNVSINAQPATPSIPTLGTITQPTCSVATGSVILNGLPASGSWTVTRSPGGTTYTGTGTSTTISGLPAGNTYSFTVTNSAGCTSGSSNSVSINTQPVTPSAPTVGTITQPTCSAATGSVVLNGLPASGSWTVTRSPGGTTYTGSGTSITISGLTAGTTYTFTVTNSVGCTSSASNNVVISTQPVTPSAPSIGAITQPTCSVPTGSVFINGLPSSGTWTITRSPGGTTSTGSGTSTTISGLPAGNTYTFTVTNADGCTSGSSNGVAINTQPPTPSTPTVGTITQPTCAVAIGSVVLSNLPSSGTWTVTRSPGGTTNSGTGTSTTITGLTAGTTYTFTVTNSYGCTSTSTGSVAINTQPVTPAAPTAGTIVQPSCDVATGTISLTGLPSSGTWTIIRSPGGTTYSGTGTSTTITGLSPGTYAFTVTNADGCTSEPSVGIVINTQPVTPSAPTIGTITQPTCTVATGSVILNGLPASGTWTITVTPGGTTTTGTGTSTTISGLTDGTTYTFTVTNSDGCTSLSTGNVVINIQPPTPAVPAIGTITQPSCTTATGSVVINGLPSTGTWILTRSPSGTTTTGSGTTTTVSGLSAGTYTFTVTNDAGCVSGSTVDVVIDTQPVTPTPPSISTVTQPTCTVATGNVNLNGLPATGTWTLTRYPGETTTDGTGTSATISDLVAGTYTFTVTNAAGCTSASSGDVVINAQPPTPTAPVVGNITHPTCAVATGSVALSGLPATGTWTLTRSPDGTIITGTGTTITVSGLSAGTYTFTVTNSSGCVSVTSGNVVINTQPVTPSAPTLGTITQPTTENPTGSVVLTGLPASGEWTLTMSPGGVNTSGTGTTRIISGLAPGRYTFTVTNAYGCTSASSPTAGLYALELTGPDNSALNSMDTIKIDDPDAGSFIIDVESNSEWSVTDNSLWLQAVKNAETSDIEVTYMENISVFDKVAAMRISYSSNPDKVIYVRQNGRVSQLIQSKFDDVILYPNPAGSFIYIKLSEYEFEKIRISITNIYGNLILKKEFDDTSPYQTIELNISSFTVGQYFITITDEVSQRTYQLIKY